MNTPDERWWSVRAGEYVLGTLQDSDLKLFERILAHDTHVQAEVMLWERRLTGLNETAKTHKPAAHVWPHILERVRLLDDGVTDHQERSAIDSANIDFNRQNDPPSQLSAPIPIDSSRKLKLWQTVAGFATAACLVLGVLLWLQMAPTSSALRVDGVAVVLSDESGQPYFLVETDYKNSRVRVTTLAPPSLDESRDFQLWQALPDRSSVRPVALLPEEPGTSRIFTIDSLITGSDLFGVSVEPVGAVTDGGPTGPVVAHGDFLPTRNID